MTGLIVTPEAGTVPASEPDYAKDGEYYDRCPFDGCVEVERSYKIGGRDGRGETYLDASIYFSDPRRGGCGRPWSRTTRQGAEQDEERGVPTRWLTRSARRGRSVFIPSERYRENYARIFGHE